MQYLVDRLHLLVRRRMQHDDDRPDQTYRAPNLAQQPQLLVEEIRPQHRANQHRQRAQRRHQNGRRKRIRRKVEDLAEHHCHPLATASATRSRLRVRTRRYARPPRRIAQVAEAIAVEAMLLHGRIEALFRYDKAGADGERRAHGQHEADISVLRISIVSPLPCARPAAGVTYLSSTIVAV
jgi:hypothetical protein